MADKAFVLVEHEPESEFPVVIVGVYATRELAEAAERSRRTCEENESKLTWPESDHWSIEWLIEELGVIRAPQPSTSAAR